MKHGNSQNGKLPVFRERLRILQGDLSIVSFANKLNLSRQTVGFYLNGERIPDALTLAEIAKKCGVSSDYLIGLSETATSDPKIKDIIAFTGLSEDTVKRLYAWNNLKESTRDISENSPDHIKEIAEDLSWVNNPDSFRESLIELSNILLGSYLKHPRMITRWYQGYLHSLYTWYSTLKSTDEHDIFLKADEVDDSIQKYGLVTITAEDAAQNTISRIMDYIADYLEFEAKSIIFKELDLEMPNDEIPLR